MMTSENFKTICDVNVIKDFLFIYLDAFLINYIFYNAECGNYTFLKKSPGFT